MRININAIIIIAIIFAGIFSGCIDKRQETVSFNSLVERINVFNKERFSPTPLGDRFGAHYQEWHDIVQILVNRANLSDKVQVYAPDKAQHDIGVADGEIFIENMEVQEGEKYDTYKMVKYWIGSNFSVVKEERWTEKGHERI